MSTMIAVIDGKGGGIGKAICQRLSGIEGIELIALGTNSLATSAMLKAGAKDAATGENAICHIASKADIVVGPIAILVANSMMGEISEKMAEGIANSDAQKLLLPMQNVHCP